MKKLAIIFIACLACSQAAHAATTALVESLLEYEAITNFIGAPNFTTISSSEFIVDIQRLTRRVNILGTVQYEICTQEVQADTKNKAVFHDYIATLFVAPNPGIGPNIVTVISIQECSEHED